MSKSLVWRGAIAAFFVVIALIYLMPSLSGDLPGWWSNMLPRDKIHLGLDLQGGMHLVLEVEALKAVESRLERVVEELKLDLRKSKIRYLELKRHGTELVTLTLMRPGDTDNFRGMAEANYPDFETKLISSEENQPVFHLVLLPKSKTRIMKMAVDQGLETIRNRIDQFGVSEPDIRPQEDNRILVQLPGIRDPKRAIDQFRILVDKYRFYLKRDYAQYRLCQILYILSRWKDLKIESLKGIKLFKKSKYATSFQLFLAKAYIYLEMYYEAKKVCLDITKLDHRNETLTESLLLISYINKKTFGHAQIYIKSLSELITGYSTSKKIPTVIYLLGKYYEAKGNYDRSYSAYTDLSRRFPKSPESVFANRRLEYIKRFKPSKTAYIPNSKILKNIDKIDLHPEIGIVDENEGDIIYSVSLGSFYRLKDAREIKNLIIILCAFSFLLSVQSILAQEEGPGTLVFSQNMVAMKDIGKVNKIIDSLTVPIWQELMDEGMLMG